MAGTTGRSGGNRKPFKVAGKLPTGTPAEPERELKLPEKPTGLTADLSNCWDSILEQLPHEVLAPIDVHELKFLVTLICHADHLAKNIEADPSDASSRRLYLQTFKEVHRLSAVFGLNPADRSRLGIEPPNEEPDLFSDFINRTGQFAAE